MKPEKLLILLIIIIAFSLISNVNAGEINNNTFTDLSFEIDNTLENHTLTLDKNYENTDNSTYITVTKTLTIDGNNHTINGNNHSRILWIKADNFCIKNTTFTNTNSKLAGGSISWWGDNATLINCRFINSNAVSAGGAIYFKGNNITLINCTFTNNHVNYGADHSLTNGQGFDPSKPHIQTVDSAGGALFFSGDNINIDNCKFTDNTAMINGGAVTFSWSNNISISNSQFRKNKAESYAGAICLNGDNLTITNSLFNQNNASQAMDILLNSYNNKIINNTFENNNTIEVWYNVTLINNTYSKSFEQLSRLINESNGSITLTDDYYYISGSNKGILISKPIIIDGAGHCLDGRKLSRMFNIISDDVVIKNINFINGNAFGQYFKRDVGGGAIYWSGNNGLLINSTFINNTGSGIENDPFDREETIVTEDGLVLHTISIRPMGAKINEGGAIVWNGTNGTVINSTFINNAVGYPNTGGAICWRGDNGSVINSVFTKNEAWCGAAIAWIGDNGKVLSSKIMDNGFFDGGIYWFGDNGTVNNSVLLGFNTRSVLRPSDADVNANNNFWGDTVYNPNNVIKSGNVTTWMVMNYNHNGDFINSGESIQITYDVNLKYENHTLIKTDSMNYSGKINYTADKTGFLNITFKNNEINIAVDSKNTIISNDLTKYYADTITYKVNVYDLFGKVVGKTVQFKINTKNYNVKTDKNGVAKLKLNLKPGTYTVKTVYDNIVKTNKITVKKTIITKNIVMKYKKPSKFKVKLLNSKGKVYKKQSVKITLKNKVYKVKTNNKGVATLKLPKTLKKGTYKIKTTYKSLTVVNKIKVKA